MRLCAITDEISQDVNHALAVLREYGCEDAELRNVYNKYIVEADADLLNRVEADLRQHNMRVACLDTPLFKCELDGTMGNDATGPTHGAQNRTLDEQMTLLQRSIDLCKRFGTNYIRVFSFWRRGPLTPDLEDRIAAALTRPCEVADRAGITLLLENEHACYLGTGAEAARMVERIGSPALRLIWDAGNGYMAGEQPYPAGFEAALPYTLHLHVKDAKVGALGLPQWAIVGDGDIDYRSQFRDLKARGFAGAISLETHFAEAGKTQEETSRACLAAMKQLIDSV